MPLQSPYDPTGKLWKRLHTITGRVSQEDYSFFKEKFPAEGTINAIVAHLFKGLIDELRHINSVEPIEFAWCVDHPAYLVLQRLLQRRATRPPSGQESPRDDTGGTSSVRKKVRTTTKQRPKPSGGDTRGWNTEGGEGEEKE